MDNSEINKQFKSVFWDDFIDIFVEKYFINVIKIPPYRNDLTYSVIY